MNITRAYKSAEFTIYIVATLIGIGLVMVYSTHIGASDSPVNSDLASIFKHFLWILFGTVALIAMMKIDYHILQKYYIVLLIVSIVGLILVLIPWVGAEINGARRWIRFGSLIGFQPSELAKIAMVIFLSSYIVKNNGKMRQFKRGFIIPSLIIAVVLSLLIIEPDFGTAIFLLIISVTLLITGGTRITYVVFTIIALVPHFHKMLFEVSYRKDRLFAFLDPWKDPGGNGYHIIQSWIALGSGGLFGKGLGASRQKLYFLPESSNDFILTIIGEEIGFLGAGLVIALFGLFVWHGLKIARSAPDLFGFLLAFGITMIVGLQAAINIAVISGSIPTKGIPLPFISAGGSSLFFSMLGVGILLNIARQCNKEVPKVKSA